MQLNVKNHKAHIPIRLLDFQLKDAPGIDIDLTSQPEKNMVLFPQQTVSLLYELKLVDDFESVDDVPMDFAIQYRSLDLGECTHSEIC